MPADSVTAAFTASLRRLRAERGLSRPALAELARVGVGSIRHLENGDGSPTLSTAGRLAAALGVPLADMIAAEPDEDAESRLLEAVHTAHCGSDCTIGPTVKDRQITAGLTALGYRRGAS